MRDASSYRAARRNDILRGDPQRVWGQQHYFSRHKAHYGRATVLSKNPSRYHPVSDLRAHAIRRRPDIRAVPSLADARDWLKRMAATAAQAMMAKSRTGAR